MATTRTGLGGLYSKRICAGLCGRAGLGPCPIRTDLDEVGLEAFDAVEIGADLVEIGFLLIAIDRALRRGLAGAPRQGDGNKAARHKRKAAHRQSSLNKMEKFWRRFAGNGSQDRFRARISNLPIHGQALFPISRSWAQAPGARRWPWQSLAAGRKTTLWVREDDVLSGIRRRGGKHLPARRGDPEGIACHRRHWLQPAKPMPCCWWCRPRCCTRFARRQAASGAGQAGGDLRQGHRARYRQAGDGSWPRNLPGAPFAILSGPILRARRGAGLPTAVTVAAEKRTMGCLAARLQASLGSRHLQALRQRRSHRRGAGWRGQECLCHRLRRGRGHGAGRECSRRASGPLLRGNGSPG